MNGNVICNNAIPRSTSNKGISFQIISNGLICLKKSRITKQPNPIRAMSPYICHAVPKSNRRECKPVLRHTKIPNAKKIKKERKKKKKKQKQKKKKKNGKIQTKNKIKY